MFVIRPSAPWLLLLALACSQREEAGTDTNARAASAAPAATAMRPPGIVEPDVLTRPGSAERPPYVSFNPPGAWRLASGAAIANVVVWADQILIRHEDARNEVPFNLAYWYSAPPPSTRTRAEALALAQQIAAELARAPDSFGALARLYSEDLTSRDEGGALGGLSVAQLSLWPRVLDALAAAPPGRASNVVETRYGFHIFRRREPPSEQTLSGAHIVIGHDQAEWLKMQARGPLPSRSREQAQALASELYQQAMHHPEHFYQLVERYSEHRDALLRGDFGSWSTREPNPFPLRMQRLEQLAVGQVGAPVETHLGFEVILRTDPPPREQYAVRALQLPFNPDAPDEADDGRARVLARAEALASSYAAEPQRFAAPGEPPTVLMQWQSGRGIPALDQQVQRLEIGAVSAVPVQSEFSFQLSQRVAPEPASVPRYETELPAPAHPDVAYHGSQLPAAELRELLLASGQLLAAELPPGSSASLRRLRKLHERAPLPDAADPEQMADALDRVLQQTRALLGASTYTRYFSVLQRELAAALLAQAQRDSIAERGL